MKVEQFMDECRRVAGYALAIAGSSGVVVLCGLGPPIPPPKAVPFLTSLVSFVVLLAVYHYGVRHKAAGRTVDKWFSNAALGALVVAIIYVVMLGTMAQFENGKFYARGLWYRPDLQQRLTMRPPVNPQGDFDATQWIDEASSTDDLLDYAGNKARDVYEPWTVTVVELAFLLVWCAGTFFISAAIGTSIVPDARGPKRRPKKRGP